MAQYLCILRGGDDEIATMSDTNRDAHMQDWYKWIARIAEKGSYKGGDPLDANHKILRKKGSEVIYDGPYTDSKEIVGGYLILEANSLDEACEISKGCPIFDVNGSVEVAQIMPVGDM